MKKIIILTMLSLMSSVYALDLEMPEKGATITMIGSPQTIKEKDSQIKHDERSNKNYLYEFDFSSVSVNNIDRKEQAIYKYVTNNTDSVATVTSLESMMRRNWSLGREYTKNIRLKSEYRADKKMVCNYSNGLVIKVKPYGDYIVNCPLKA